MYPVVVTMEQFEAWAQEAWQAIPVQFKSQIQNLAIFVQDVADPGLLQQLGIRNKYHLLGLYQGVPLSHRGSFYMNVMPDSITLFMLPILRQCRTVEEVKNQIQQTLIHELAHHFGFNETEVRDAMGG